MAENVPPRQSLQPGADFDTSGDSEQTASFELGGASRKSVGALCVAEREISGGQAPARRAHRVVGVPIDLLVLDVLPRAFDEHVVAPTALAVPADAETAFIEPRPRARAARDPPSRPQVSAGRRVIRVRCGCSTTNTPLRRSSHRIVSTTRTPDVPRALAGKRMSYFGSTCRRNRYQAAS